jgi:hypothetical protein
MPDGHPHIAVFSYKEDGPFFLNFLPVEEPVALYGPAANTFGEEDFRKLDALAQKLLRTRPVSGEVDQDTMNVYIHRGPEGGCDYRVGNHVVRSDWRRLASLDEVIAVVDKWADGFIRSAPPSAAPPSPGVP